MTLSMHAMAVDTFVPMLGTLMRAIEMEVPTLAPARAEKDAPNQLGVGDPSPEAPAPIEVRVVQKVN